MKPLALCAVLAITGGCSILEELRDRPALWKEAGCPADRCNDPAPDAGAADPAPAAAAADTGNDPGAGTDTGSDDAGGTDPGGDTGGPGDPPACD